MLTAQLEVLAKMKNPRALYREPELNRLYFDLLSHKNPEIQKEALRCIITYKYKYLTPYQEHLFNLIDEKNFKNELISFKIDSESTLVQQEHREGLMPVVIQIVFAKMTSKVGLRTGGKGAGQQRRNLILRFLAGCSAAEMKVFIDKTFRIYYTCIKENQEIDVEEISKSIDLEMFFLPKRLLSSLHLLDLILEHFGGLLSEALQKDLLKTLLVMGTYVRKALLMSSEIHAGYLPPLRTARAICFKILTKFFQLFEEHPWSSNELGAIFEAFVWPYLDKLATEGIYSPTALLKLFSQWCSNAKYFPLLVKLNKANETAYVLYHVVQLLINPHCKTSVATIIMEMLENLLTLQDEENAKKLPVDNLKPIEDNIINRLSLNEKLNYGSCILLPLVPSILEKMKLKLQKSKAVSKRELSILSRITELVWEADICDNVLQIFLPIVLRKCGYVNEEIVCQQLSTICNLLSNVEKPLKYLKAISPMFAEVSYVSGRKILCQILQEMSKKGQDFSEACDLILLLNAWDTKWLDQPDFEKRGSALKQIQVLVESSSLNLELGILLVYNCYYFVTKESDLSLRDNASHSLKIIVPYLIQTYKANIDYVLNETVLALIRNSFKNKSDEVRYECITLLGCVARECAEAHVVLQDLSKFANKADLEVDCFENLTHMQLHRHTRAMLKISQVLKEQTMAPSARTLTQFVLPMTTFYLCNEKYVNKNSLIDAVIEVINTVCHLLPWHQYEVILKFYLRKLQHKSDYQRQLVRTVVAILDAFHYDLRKGNTENNQTEAAQIALVDSKDSKLDVDNITEVDEEVDNEVNEEEDEIEEALDSEVLESSFANEEEGDEEEEQKELAKELAVEKTSVLCKSTASRVIRSIEVSRAGLVTFTKWLKFELLKQRQLLYSICFCFETIVTFQKKLLQSLGYDFVCCL